MIPRDRFVLSTLEDVKPFIVICGIIGTIVGIVVSEVNSDSSLNTFLCLVDSEVEETVL